jgi:hypothetical protein
VLCELRQRQGSAGGYISPHPNAVPDGADVGANIDALLAATADVKQPRASSNLEALLIPARIVRDGEMRNIVAPAAAPIPA